MNVRKILAGTVASALAVSAMTVAASADVSFPYTAKLGFADGSWAVQDWDTSIEITGDGTYTITSNFAPWADEETGADIPAEANGATVFVIDIAKIGADMGLTGEENDADVCTFSNVKVTTDGKEITLDQSKLRWGDIEGKGNIRLEIYNAYGLTCTNESYDAAISPINPADIVAAKEISVTFTVSGIGGEAAAEPSTESNETPDVDKNTTPADDNNNAAPADDNNAAPADGNAAPAGNTNTGSANDKNNADTGVEGVAAIAGIAIVAAGAIIVAKKRK